MSFAHALPPRYQTSLIGRREELAAVERALAQATITSITGPGGVGKTRLAAEVVRDLRACFFDLTPARSPSEAIALLSRAFSSRKAPEDGRDKVAHAAAALSEIDADVLLLDNLEQIEGVSALIERLAEGSEKRWLLTSRLPIACSHREICLSPFASSGESSEAVDLFLRALPGSVPADIHLERSRIAAVAAALEGNPLALELAAARMSVLSLGEIEERLHDPLRLLVDPSRPEDKGSALWRSVSWSIELLSDAARQALMALSVFPSGFDRKAAIAVVGEDVLPHLERLVEGHLLREEGGRLTPPAVVARFAEAMLERSGQRGRAEIAHARWCQAVLQKEPDKLWENYAVIGADVEQIGFRASLPGCDPELSALCQWIFGACSPVHHVRMTRRDYAAKLLAIAPRLDSALSVRIHIRRAYALFDCGLAAEARALLDEVVAYSEAHGLSEVLAVGLSNLADLAYQEQQFDRMERLNRSALEVARRAGLERIELQFLMGLVNVPHLHNGRFAEVLENFSRARALVPSLPHLASAIDMREALVHLEAGDFDASERLLDALARRPEIRPHDEMGRRVAVCRLALVRGPRPSEVASQLMVDMPMVRYNETLSRLALAARCLDRLASPEAVAAAVAPLRVSALRNDRQELVWIDLAAAVMGIVPEPLDDQRDLVLSACSSAIALVRQALLGQRTPESALEASLEIRPVCWEIFLARRVLSMIRDERAALRVAGDGSWFVSRGQRVEIASHSQRNILAALASDKRSGGQGLSVEALFLAGWPSARAEPRSAANRVRVAVTALRRSGLPVSFARGLGWSLAARVA